jgi:hypothetical protein
MAIDRWKVVSSQAAQLTLGGSAFELWAQVCRRSFWSLGPLTFALCWLRWLFKEFRLNRSASLCGPAGRLGEGVVGFLDGDNRIGIASDRNSPLGCVSMGVGVVILLLKGCSKFKKKATAVLLGIVPLLAGLPPPYQLGDLGQVPGFSRGSRGLAHAIASGADFSAVNSSVMDATQCLVLPESFAHRSTAISYQTNLTNRRAGHAIPQATCLKVRPILLRTIKGGRANGEAVSFCRSNCFARVYLRTVTGQDNYRRSQEGK